MSHQSQQARGKGNSKSKHVPASNCAPSAVAAPAHPPNGRSAASVAAAAAAARRQLSHNATTLEDDDESRDADVEYVAAEPLDDDPHAPPPSGVLTFMRRSRSDSAAADPALFRMDSDEVAAASGSSHHHAPLPHRLPRRGSVEAEMQLPLPDEDDLLDGTVPLEIGRADSPEVEEEEKEGEKGVELESVLINRAAAAAAAASVPASAYRSAIAARPPGGLSVGDFELLSVVGRGAYGKVFLVRAHASGRLYAMKVVMKSEAIRKNVVANMLAEKNVLEAVRHPFIVNLRFAFQTESKLYLVLDYIGGGELFARLNASKDHSLDVKAARFYAAEIVLAIEHLHSLSIVYRDLKPENCLLTRDGHICLTDFGFAKESIAEAGSGTKSFCGTLHYMSPEMIQYAGHGKGSDWWALGALLHEMLTGSTPFSGNNRKTIQDNILTAPLKLPKWMDNPTKSILTELLRRPVSKRLGCGPDGAAAIKKHAFFAGIDWKLLAQKKIPAPFVPPMSEAGEACTRNFDVKFTAERAVDTPVSPSQMAHVLAGHGISPGAFLTADATFANFAYKRDHTPAASPMLRGLDPSLMRRQGSTGSASGVPIGSPRPLSGLPPPHHPVHHHLQLPHPESLELTPPAAAKAATAAASTAAAAASPAAEPVESVAWPTVDPAVLKQREQQAAAKAAARKAAQQQQQQQQGQPATPASPPPSAAAAAPAPASVASPPRVKKPKPMKANASPPAPVDTRAAAEIASPSSAAAASAVASTSASPISPAPASSSSSSASPSSARSGPSGGASSQLSKQLAARQQNNQQQQSAQSQAPSVTVRPPPGRGWESKSAAAPSAAAPAPTLPLNPPPPAASASPAAPAASVAPSGLGIRVLGGIKSLAPVPVAAPAAAAGALLPSPAPVPTASSSAAAAPSSSTPLRLSAAAKVFVPGQWGAPKPPVAATAAPVVAPAAATHPASAVAAGLPIAARAVAAASASTTQTAKPVASTVAPAPATSVAAAAAPATATAPSSNPLGPARWGARASAPAPIPQKKA